MAKSEEAQSRITTEPIYCGSGKEDHIFPFPESTVCLCRKAVRFKSESNGTEIIEPTAARRNPTSVRYDILDPNFLRALAQIAHYGAEKYGDLNWHKSRLEGDKSPVNHIYKHLGAYRNSEPYDHSELGQHRKWHLAAVAFNAMMEFWYESQDK